MDAHVKRSRSCLRVAGEKTGVQVASLGQSFVQQLEAILGGSTISTESWDLPPALCQRSLPASSPPEFGQEGHAVHLSTDRIVLGSLAT